MKAPLTPRQNEAYEFIRSYMQRHHKPPTLREIGDALSLRSINAVSKLLAALERKGHIEREPNAARGVRLVAAETDPFQLDDPTPNLMVVSRTPSDQPELLRKSPASFLSIDPYFLRKVRDVEACFVGRAGDDGMSTQGIQKGDLLLIEELPDLPGGTLVAALVGEDLLARHYTLANDRIHLRPANRVYAELTFRPGDPGCHLIGRIFGLMRRY